MEERRNNRRLVRSFFTGHFQLPLGVQKMSHLMPKNNDPLTPSTDATTDIDWISPENDKMLIFSTIPSVSKNKLFHKT